jgi:FkbM family methyltransferase
LPYFSQRHKRMLRRLYRRSRAAAVRLLIAMLGPFVALFYRNLIPHHGCLIDTSHPIIPSFLKGALWLHQYERQEMKLLKSHFRWDVDVIELGSSIGVVASYAGRNLPSGRRLICVEADERLMTCLKSNLLLNVDKVEIQTVHAAIAYGVSEVNFAVSKNPHASAVGAKGPKVTVPAVTLEEIASRFSLTRFSLICDVEGAEVALILRGNLEHCEQLLIELHKTRYAGRLWSVADLIQLLTIRHNFVVRDRCANVVLLDRRKEIPSGL